MPHDTHKQAEWTQAAGHVSVNKGLMVTNMDRQSGIELRDVPQSHQAATNRHNNTIIHTATLSLETFLR